MSFWEIFTWCSGCMKILMPLNGYRWSNQLLKSQMRFSSVEMESNSTVGLTPSWPFSTYCCVPSFIHTSRAWRCFPLVCIGKSEKQQYAHKPWCYVSSKRSKQTNTKQTKKTPCTEGQPGETFFYSSKSLQRHPHRSGLVSVTILCMFTRK